MENISGLCNEGGNLIILLFESSKSHSLTYNYKY